MADKKNNRGKGKGATSRRTWEPRKPEANRPRLVAPSGDAMRRIESIPLLFGGKTRPKQSIPGKIVYDSWAHGPAMALRDATDGHVRRLRLKAGSTSVELLAERNRNSWSFVARVYQGRNIAHDFVLEIGSRRYIAGPGGFFQWSSDRVPRQLALVSYDSRLCFDEVSWS